MLEFCFETKTVSAGNYCDKFTSSSHSNSFKENRAKRISIVSKSSPREPFRLPSGINEAKFTNRSLLIFKTLTRESQEFHEPLKDTVEVQLEKYMGNLDDYTLLSPYLCGICFQGGVKVTQLLGRMFFSSLNCWTMINCSQYIYR